MHTLVSTKRFQLIWANEEKEETKNKLYRLWLDTVEMWFNVDAICNSLLSTNILNVSNAICALLPIIRMMWMMRMWVIDLVFIICTWRNVHRFLSFTHQTHVSLLMTFNKRAIYSGKLHRMIRCNVLQIHLIIVVHKNLCNILIPSNYILFPTEYTVYTLLTIMNVCLCFKYTPTDMNWSMTFPFSFFFLFEQYEMKTNTKGNQNEK